MKSRQLYITVFMSFLGAACTHGVPLRNLEELPSISASGEVLETSPTLAAQVLERVKDKPVLLEFSIDHCPPCEAIEEDMANLAKAGLNQYLVLRVNVSDDLAALQGFGLEPRFPSFILTIPGEKAALKRYGSPTIEQLKTWLTSKRDVRRHNLSYAPRAFQKAPKAVLVAGSADNANFGQEILWMHDWLRGKGLRDEEISCFYAKPDLLQYFSDRDQFEGLTPFLRNCRPATREEILRSIQAGISKDPAAFFFYITSHGAPPDRSGTETINAESCTSFAPSLYLDAGPPGCERLSNITPDAIAAVIPKDNKTLKTMVFQGCYSGGFISPKDDAQEYPSALAKLPNMTIFTASNAQRPSFGCNSGNDATFYGLSFALVTTNDQQPLEQTDWAMIASEVKKLVEKQEKKFGLRRSQHSEPQFITH